MGLDDLRREITDQLSDAKGRTSETGWRSMWAAPSKAAAANAAHDAAVAHRDRLQRELKALDRVESARPGPNLPIASSGLGLGAQLIIGVIVLMAALWLWSQVFAVIVMAAPLVAVAVIVTVLRRRRTGTPVGKPVKLGIVLLGAVGIYLVFALGAFALQQLTGDTYHLNLLGMFVATVAGVIGVVRVQMTHRPQRR